MTNRAKGSKSNRNTKPKKQPPPPKSGEKHIWRYLSPTNKFWVGFALLLAITGAYYTLSPKISVTPSPLLEPDNPFSAPFIVKNDGNLTIHSISYRLASFRMRSTGNARVIIPKGVDYSEKILIDTLIPGEKTTIGLPNLNCFKFNEPIAYIDLVFVVIYRPDYWPFKAQKQFRFGLSKNPNSWTWLPRSISE